uniref:Uncharacterized protein n=1 Tax=Arundo donax TaxID=35708 RepID=A0A0A9HK48_ARUDO
MVVEPYPGPVIELGGFSQIIIPRLS